MVEDLIDGESRLGGSFRGMKTLKPSGSSGIVTMTMFVGMSEQRAKLRA